MSSSKVPLYLSIPKNYENEVLEFGTDSVAFSDGPIDVLAVGSMFSASVLGGANFI